MAIFFIKYMINWIGCYIGGEIEPVCNINAFNEVMATGTSNSTEIHNRTTRIQVNSYASVKVESVLDSSLVAKKLGIPQE